MQGLLNEARTIVPLPKEFDPKQWERGTRDEIVDHLTGLTAARYDAGLDDFAKMYQTQMQMANPALDDLALTKDPLQRAIYTHLRKHLGEQACDDLEAAKTGLNDLPEQFREKAAAAFKDGVRLFRDRAIMIQIVDQLWVKHLTDLDELREGIGLRAYAQKDPLVAYRTEASRTYEELIDSINEQVSKRIFNAQFTVNAPQQQAAPKQQRNGNGAGNAAPLSPAARAPIDRAINRAAMKASGGGSVAAAPSKPIANAGKKIGRNDVCPFCDTGKKVKACDCAGAKQWRGDV